MIRKLGVLILSVLVLGLALFWLDHLAIEVSAAALFGWLSFPARVVPRLTVAWSGVAMAVVCLVLFTAGLHRFLRWLYKEIRVESESAWRPRWTGTIVAIVVVMFVAGLAATGIVHQTGWLLTSRESWVVPRVWPSAFEDPNSSVARLQMTGLAVLNYNSSRDHLPLGRFDDQGRPIQSWMTVVLPYMPFSLQGIDLTIPWDDPANSAYFRGIVPDFLNPNVTVIRDARGYALSHYAGNVHVVGRPRPLELGEVTSGASNTIVAGEAADGFRAWGDPANLRDPIRGIHHDTETFGGPSRTGAQMLFLDGSVRFLSRTTSPKVLQSLSLPRPPG